ncbi:hypothetical protein EJB05_02067 [Eragrostis curvula]|uniref:BUB1 N-terminal domain-containing protein n=1 Tax=Eragrostis curvula TaxID=38414 RepID=A0A5J9WRZ2_9POAL|nr:hypothetical protein EJB05_02067 [Eragrostis curvula]
MAAGEQVKELLASVVGEIRSYAGSDPLRPWLRGVRKMEKELPPETLREKLPRFLQKCAEEFQDHARYRDDARYVRVWIQMMDYVKDAKPLLKKMEQRGIGHKRASFYMAYALYYEKNRRFEPAEKMYRLGIQNLAEPIGELHKAHEQFVHRMELHKRRKEQKEKMSSKTGSNATSTQQTEGESINCKVQKSSTMQKSGSSSNPSLGCYPPLGPAKVSTLSRGMSEVYKNLSRCNSDDTVVVRFVGSALVGRSETEDACHHGLVEPTINTKEAMDAINSMFLEPLEPETMLKRRSKHEKTNHNHQTSTFDIFVDEDQPDGNNPNNVHKSAMKQEHLKFSRQTSGFEIFVDEDSAKDGANGNKQNAAQNRNSEKENMKLNHQTGRLEIFVDEYEANGNVKNGMCHEIRRPPRPLCDSSSQHGKCEFQKPFVGGFAILPDDEDEQCENIKLNQDASGFEIFIDEYEANGNVQNAMHHKNNLSHPRPLSDSSSQRGNSDFQKPFVGGFAILPDDEDEQHEKSSSNVFCSEQGDIETRYHEGSQPVISGLREDTVIHRFVGSTVVGEPKVENACHHGLVDPTVNLKEAMNDINSMFGKPLNFKGEKAKNRKINALSNKIAAPVSGFSILADDNLEEKSTGKANQSSSCNSGAENGLFEPTITTRDVMAEINDMFGMPLDF